LNDRSQAGGAAGFSGPGIGALLAGNIGRPWEVAAYKPAGAV